jgi:hypothetical protein
MPEDWEGIPGSSLVRDGLADLDAGATTVEALLVAVGAPRLRWLGVPVPASADGFAHPELALYEAVCTRGQPNAHAAYNALIARLVSFERELERRMFRERRLARGTAG